MSEPTTAFDWQSPNYEPVIQDRIVRLDRLRAEPGLAAKVKEFYRSNPVAFINDFGQTFDPRLIDLGIEATVPFMMFPRQCEFLDWVRERWMGRQDGLVEKSRDMGISWLCVAFAVWMFLFHEGAVIGFGSRKELYVDDIGNPASLFWKIRQFIALLPPEFRPLGWDEKKHAPFMRIMNPENGNVIVGEAGDNIGRGNRTSIYFVDEAAFLDRPETVAAALSQTSNCRIWVSTPNGAGNPFYRMRHGGKVPVFVFDWREDPRKDQAWYDKQCEKLEPHVVAQEIDRNYEASVVNAFIAGSLVDECQRRGPASVQAIGKLRVGVDPARFGDDKFAVTIRRGRAVILQVENQKLDTIQGATWVRSLIQPYGERPEQIAVDVIGVGAGVADQLRAWYGPIVVDINSSIRMDGEDAKQKMALAAGGTLYYNMRAYMYGQMRDWLAQQASIPMDSDLKAELTAIRYSYRGGSILLESKDDMRKRGVKSPNKADSLALTFADPTSPESLTAHPIFHNPSLQLGRTPAGRAGY